MDIQVPSNLERYLYEHLDHSGVQVEATLRAFRATGEIRLDERAFAGFAASWGDDRAIIETIRTIYQRHGLVVDPHTALAWAAATTHRLGSPMVVLATAHPAKFPEAIREAIGTEPALPADLADLLGRPERSYRLPNDLAALHELLAT
jgi:threonine synthase